MPRLVTAIAIALSLATAAHAAPPDCTAFLTGHWTGKGDINMFGTTTSLDNAYTYNADGTFETVNRYKSGDGEWQEQAITGTWTTKAGEDPDTCTLEMTSTFDSGGVTGSSSSTSDFTYVDDDTFRSMDFDMHRTKPE